MGVAGLAALALVTAACGSGAGAGQGAAAPPPAARSSMLTSLSAGHGAAWAVVEVGGSRAAHNNFWQLLVRPAGRPGVAAGHPAGRGRQRRPGRHGPGAPAPPPAAPGLVAGFVPSQDLTFSPLATSRDGGRHWAPGLLPSGLAAAASALAAGPDGRLLALTRSRGAAVRARAAPAGSPLVTTKALAASPAGRSCGLTGLTAVAFGSAGAPLLAGACSHPGVTGIFSGSGRPVAAGRRGAARCVRRPAGHRCAADDDRAGKADRAPRRRSRPGPAPATAGRARPGPRTWPRPGSATASRGPRLRCCRWAAGTLVSTAAGADGTAGVIMTGGRAAVIRPATRIRSGGGLDGPARSARRRGGSGAGPGTSGQRALRGPDHGHDLAARRGRHQLVAGPEADHPGPLRLLRLTGRRPRLTSALRTGGRRPSPPGSTVRAAWPARGPGPTAQPP